MPESLDITELRTSVEQLGADSDSYFEEALTALPDSRPDVDWQSGRDSYWEKLPEPLRGKAGALVDRLVTVAGQIAVIVRNAPLISEADQRDVMTATKTMRSALLLRRFRSWTTEILHDEGI